MRIRVRVDVFCFYCGMLGHADTSCVQLFQRDEDDGVRGWGPELKVECWRE